VRRLSISRFPLLQARASFVYSRLRTLERMAHIELREDLPGVRGLMVFRPETAEPLNQLADILLRGPNTLSPGEREPIAAFVSSRNDCFFCQSVHGAVAAYHLDNAEKLVSDKMKALLAIAGKVQRGGKEVTGKPSPVHGSAVRATWKSTTRCSSRRPFVCSIAMSTGWERGLDRRRYVSPACAP
jgi:AhpD family alkylhydroperoxidase